MPTSDPIFTQMVTKVQAGDVKGAADLATHSKYFANYLARRMALQMQSPALDASTSSDSDATAFLIAHFVGNGSNVQPSISSIWSENATYLVTPANSTTPVHAASMKAADLAAVDWSTALVQQAGQMAKDAAGSTNAVAIPAKHVGGYVTLSDRGADNSFAMYGATAGTNLRMIEGIWEIATGFQLVDVENTQALPSDVPRFVPEYNPNFFHGQGQAACIACHGGGMSSLTHGYAAVADVFDYDAKNGLVYIAAPTQATMKSLGSDPKKRKATATCTLTATPTPVCNPDSAGADPNQAWDLKLWSSAGVLSSMGWTGAISGQGLNELGVAIGKSSAVYEFLTKRVIKEICPMGAFTASDVSAIAAAANPSASPAGTDDIRTIVAMVAANASCQ